MRRCDSGLLGRSEAGAQEDICQGTARSLGGRAESTGVGEDLLPPLHDSTVEKVGQQGRWGPAWSRAKVDRWPRGNLCGERVWLNRPDWNFAEGRPGSLWSLGWRMRTLVRYGGWRFHAS